MTILYSNLDASVNFVTETDDGGAFEARFVQRDPNYFIVYLSSHTGCNKACRMCHLTQTGQTMMTHARHNDFIRQADQVLDSYKTMRRYSKEVLPEPEFINFNFMARGEPFANDAILNGGHRALFKTLTEMAHFAGSPRAQLNYSTIMPTEVEDVELADFLGRSHPGLNIYYSLYSMNPRFRKRWLPKAMDPRRALDKLVTFQNDPTNALGAGEVVLHWTFMEGENDSVEDVEEIIDAVLASGLKTRFNLVRYNPYSPAQGKEPADDILLRNLNLLAGAFHHRGSAPSKIVSRVGMDVKASCGMFVEIRN